MDKLQVVQECEGLSNNWSRNVRGSAESGVVVRGSQQEVE